MAGYLEGRATALDIFNFYDNLKFNNPEKSLFIQMKKFFNEVVFNLQKKIKNIETIEEDQKIIWAKLLLGYTQLEGLLHAYTYEMKRLNKYNEESKIDLAHRLTLYQNLHLSYCMQIDQGLGHIPVQYLARALVLPLSVPFDSGRPP